MLKTGQKIGAVFAVLTLLTVGVGVLSYSAMSTIGQHGSYISKRLVPLSDLALRIQVDGTRAHLLFEEIMSGDEGESIDEVWQLLSNAASYAKAILEGGEINGLTIVASNAPTVRSAIESVQADLATFTEAGRQRYANRGGGEGAGSNADEAFDQTYESFMETTEEATQFLQMQIDTMTTALDDEQKQAALQIIAMSALAAILAIAAYVFFHRTISKRLQRLADITRRLGEGDASVEVPATASRDEIGDLYNATQHFRQALIEQADMSGERLRQAEASELKAARIAELSETFRTSTDSAVQSLISAGEAMATSTGRLGQASRDAAASVDTASGAARQANGNVNAVASASDQLASAVTEIAERASNATQIVEAVSAAVSTSTKQMSDLSEMAVSIGEIVGLITDIAEQTNLLALNATIEAARAGEAGKGFAVVATEVKSLADQTAKATDGIRSQVGAMQSTATTAAGAVTAIEERLAGVTEATNAIAAAVEEQSAVTREIGGNAQEAARGTQTVSETVETVLKAVAVTDSTASEVDDASKNVSREADRMRGLVQDFMQELKAA